MLSVCETYRYLTLCAEQKYRDQLSTPMHQLQWQTEQVEVAALLHSMKVDAMDVWIGYHLLSQRESSPKGREACGWLAEQLALHLRGSGRRYDKTGAIFLWGVLCRLRRGSLQQEMYRVAAALLLPGRDLFVLTETGPEQICAEAPLRFAAAPAPQLSPPPQLSPSARTAEIREEVVVYFTGNRDRDLAPFLPSEMTIARDQWDKEAARQGVIQADSSVSISYSPQAQGESAAP